MKTLVGHLSQLIGGQNLRQRIVVAVGLFTTIAVIFFGAAVWLVVGYNLEAAVDNDLRATAALFATLDLSAPPGGLPALADSAPAAGEGRVPIPYVQVLDSSGKPPNDGRGNLPVSGEARAVALGQATDHVEDVHHGQRTIRHLTIALDQDQGGGALQVGTDITNLNVGLRRARTGTVVAGILAGIGAALMAGLFSRRLIAPVQAVAEAADSLRTERELPERLPGEGSDVLGHLVSSFNSLLDDLRNSRTQQRRLVTDASHELRTPLTSLRLKIEFIQSQPDLETEERQRLLGGAVADLSSLGALVSELAELAAEGATPERARLIDLGLLVETEVARFITTSGRQVEVTTSKGLVETRPRQVIRALTNLLVNADKYSPADRAITVTQIGPRIEVRDYGPGIPDEERARVFDRFYRGPAHQSIEGSGLGLAIVESMARANGGRVWIADPDDGAIGTVVGFTAGPTI